MVMTTTPFEGQVMGTSGLRKRVAEASKPHYLQNFVQSIFDCLPAETKRAGSFVVGGDGRYLNKEVLQIIIAMAAAQGVPQLLVARNGLASTPAISRVIRVRHAAGGFLMTASHNPGGPTHDFGLKFNTANGGPALKELTDAIYQKTKTITAYRSAVLPHPLDVSVLGTTTITVHHDATTTTTTTVEVFDATADYIAMLREAFDLPAIRKFLAVSKLRVVVDSLNAVTGPYTRAVFVDELGLPESCLANNVPMEDFGGGHPDPNLVYAKQLVDKMFSGEYDFGAAFDGDGDRNMILGNKFFVTPSDSLAVLAANHRAIRHFREGGFRGVARSMPTSAAVDRVVEALNAEAPDAHIGFFEVPTGWKFFGNLMDSGQLSLCGEESFGTGCNLIREKDGIWAAVAWLSVLAERNRDRPAGAPVIGVADIVREHWSRYGRNYYSRYDYEEVSTEAAARLMKHLADEQPRLLREGVTCGGYKLVLADDFSYVDPVDHSVTSNQGLRFVFEDGSRIIFRLSGTGSVGATIRVYFDKYEGLSEKLALDVPKALAELIQLALKWSDIAAITGRQAPTVIT